MNIYSNEKADIAAKTAAAAENNKNIINCSSEFGISLTYIRKKVKNSLLKSWYNYYNSANKEAYYQNLDIQSVWKPPNLKVKTSRIVWSSYIQLKLEHRYFKSYLKRLSAYVSDKYNCNNNNIQLPAHLLLNCSNYKAARAKIREKLQISSLSLKILLTKKEEINSVLEFLKETKIARRN
jgi:hypothetical protein